MRYELDLELEELYSILVPRNLLLSDGVSYGIITDGKGLSGLAWFFWRGDLQFGGGNSK